MIARGLASQSKKKEKQRPVRQANPCKFSRNHLAGRYRKKGKEVKKMKNGTKQERECVECGKKYIGTWEDGIVVLICNSCYQTRQKTMQRKQREVWRKEFSK